MITEHSSRFARAAGDLVWVVPDVPFVDGGVMVAAKSAAKCRPGHRQGTDVGSLTARNGPRVTKRRVRSVRRSRIQLWRANEELQ